MQWNKFHACMLHITSKFKTPQYQETHGMRSEQTARKWQYCLQVVFCFRYRHFSLLDPTVAWFESPPRAHGWNNICTETPRSPRAENITLPKTTRLAVRVPHRAVHSFAQAQHHASWSKLRLRKAVTASRCLRTAKSPNAKKNVWRK